MAVDTQDFADTLNALSEIYVASTSLVEEHSTRFMFGPARYKTEQHYSDDDPPAVAAKGQKWIDLPTGFEELLGLYQPDKYRVVVFRKGVAWLAHERDWAPKSLEQIVELHEWSHALHHLGPADPDSFEGVAKASRFAQRKRRYRAAPTLLKEQIAQLCTLVAIRGQLAKLCHPKAQAYFGTLEVMFFDLMATQSAIYRLPKATREMNLDRLRSKLLLLLRLSDQRMRPTLPDIADMLV